MAFCPEHPKRDQIMKFIPLSETTSIPASMGAPPSLGQRTDRTQCHHFVRMLFFSAQAEYSYSISDWKYSGTIIKL